MSTDAQQIPTIRSRRFELVATHLASFLTGGLIVGTIVFSYNLTPLPAALDLARAAALGLVVLAVVAALVRQATAVALRGQRELLDQLKRIERRMESDVMGIYDLGAQSARK